MGDWGLGLGIGPNPQSPIPNPQSPIPNPQKKKYKRIFQILFLVNYINLTQKKEKINFLFKRIAMVC